MEKRYPREQAALVALLGSLQIAPEYHYSSDSAISFPEIGRCGKIDETRQATTAGGWIVAARAAPWAGAPTS
ncbi:MAG TPA: hypothetical protein VLC71_12340 [Thermomonas sp.]|nr:hypothetical protein [Thermomonas sp.]